MDKNMVAQELVRIAKNLTSTQIAFTDSDSRVAKVKFTMAKKELEKAMEHLDNFVGIPSISSISNDYLSALTRIESIIDKL